MTVKDDAAAGTASTPDGAADAAAAAAAAAATAAAAAAAAGNGDGKTGDKGKEPGSKDGAAPPQPKAPEKYALTLPAGKHVDAGDLVKIEALARANEWTNEDAQAFVNQRAADIAAAATQFADETKADPIYGGAHLADTQKYVAAALDALRPLGKHARAESFRAFLDKSGYGNHIEVMSFLADLGKRMAEDQPLAGHQRGGDAAAKKDPATVLYGEGATASV